MEGKFNITLSADITKDGFSTDSCFAKLQSPALSCPIQNAQTASIKILATSEHNTINVPKMILRFSPVTCQSAFFLPHPKFPFFHNLPPLPGPPASHCYLPPTPAPAFQSPQNPPIGSPSPSPSPIYHTPLQDPPTNRPIPPPISKQLPKFPPPPSKAFHRTPFVSAPILPPIPAPHHKHPPTPPPIPILKPPPQFGPGPSPKSHPPLPKFEKPIPPPPNQRKPNPIPRAPPVPQLPPIPPVPRKYFNSPNSKLQPPHSS